MGDKMTPETLKLVAEHFEQRAFDVRRAQTEARWSAERSDAPKGVWSKVDALETDTHELFSVGRVLRQEAIRLSL